MKQVFLTIAALFGFVSCGLWFFAAMQSVDHDPDELDEDGFHPVAWVKVRDNGRKIDIFKTADRQTYWNRWAALAAGVAAAASAASSIIG